MRSNEIRFYPGCQSIFLSIAASLLTASGFTTKKKASSIQGTSPIVVIEIHVLGLLCGESHIWPWRSVEI